MYDEFSRSRLVRQAWKASVGGRFSETALIESAVSMADEKLRPKLRQALPAVWLHLDDASEVADWLAATGLDGEAIDAINMTLGAGLPPSAKKANLHEYALRPQDFPALLLLAFIAARLATPYMGGGPHRKVREQFWYVPELAIILMRCLPPKLDLLAVEHILRTLLQAPTGERPPMPLSGMVPMLGLPDLGSSYAGLDTVGMIMEDETDEEA
jgi:hypothetical protein